MHRPLSPAVSWLFGLLFFLLLAGSAAAQPATLIAQYDFNESSYAGTAGELKDTAGFTGGPFNGRAQGSALPSVASTGPARSGSPGTCAYASLPGPTNNGGGFIISGLPVSTTAGAKTSVAFWMYWNGVNSVMPIGWAVHDLWFSGANFGFNSGGGDVYGISTTGLANTWRHVVAVFTNGSIISKPFLYTGGLADWKIALASDINGDGIADLVFQNNIGQLAVWYLNGSGSTTISAFLSTTALGDWRLH